MFKKIIVPKEELHYRNDSIENKYLINEGNRALGLFAATAQTVVPAQISPQDICFYAIFYRLINGGFSCQSFFQEFPDFFNKIGIFVQLSAGCYQLFIMSVIDVQYQSRAFDAGLAIFLNK